MRLPGVTLVVTFATAAGQAVAEGAGESSPGAIAPSTASAGASAAAAAESIPVGGTGDLVILAGGVVPTSGLEEILDPAPAAGIAVNLEYTAHGEAHVEILYALLDGDRSPRTVHYVKAGAGLGARPWKRGPVVGLGAANYAARSAGHAGGEQFLIDDNESEFGFYPFMYWNLRLDGGWLLSVGASWDWLLTEPRRTSLPGIRLGVGKRLW